MSLKFLQVGKPRPKDIKGHPSHCVVSLEWISSQGTSRLFILEETKNKKHEFRLSLGKLASFKGELNIPLF